MSPEMIPSPQNVVEPNGRIRWERVEADDGALQVIVATLGYGGRDADTAALLSEYFGVAISKDAMRNRMSDSGGSQAAYLSRVQEKLREGDATESAAISKHVLEYLLQQKDVRTRVWRHHDGAKALAAYLLRETDASTVELPRVISRYLGMTPPLSQSVITNLLERRGGTEGRTQLAAELLAGIDTGGAAYAEAAAYGQRLLRIVRLRGREKAPWLTEETDGPRALVARLLQQDETEAPLDMITFALGARYGIAPFDRAAYHHHIKKWGSRAAYAAHLISTLIDPSSFEAEAGGIKDLIASYQAKKAETVQRVADMNRRRAQVALRQEDVVERDRHESYDALLHALSMHAQWVRAPRVSVTYGAAPISISSGRTYVLGNAATITVDLVGNAHDEEASEEAARVKTRSLVHFLIHDLQAIAARQHGHPLVTAARTGDPQIRVIIVRVLAYDKKERRVRMNEAARVVIPDA